ncbi:hypothetical protein HanIR_Chr09g0421291 [Helianthus annuus]|nr:hypothetical protein HanIR_Chr09g0421291 [Helianthus annuus]
MFKPVQTTFDRNFVRIWSENAPEGLKVGLLKQREKAGLGLKSAPRRAPG